MNDHGFTNNVRRATAWSFLAFVFLVAALPKGSVYGVNVKVTALALFSFFFILNLYVSGRGISFSQLSFPISVILFLIAWALLSVLNGESDTLQILYQFRDVASTILVAWLSYFLLRRRLIEASALIQTVILAAFALSALKLTLIAASLFFEVDYRQVVGWLRDIFGESLSLVTADISSGAFRIQFPPDVLAPFALFALMANRITSVRFGKVLSAIIVVVLVVAGFISFSRWIWLLFAAAVLTSLLIQRNWKRAVTAVVMGIAIAGVFSGFLRTAFELRFFSEGAVQSDEIRKQQAAVLLDEFESRPILGKGLGSHAHGFLRNDALRYSYELQWLALLMQFGLAGILFLVGLLGLTAQDLLKAGDRSKVWVGIVFILWLASGFTNPSLTSSFAGAVFSMFLAIFHRVRNVDRTPGELA